MAWPQRLSIIAVTALLFTGVARADGKAPPAAPDKAVDSILLVTVDTLRADILGIYGHSREPLPVVARWADRGLVFDRAFATSSWTVPSLASLLTSLYPTSHGAVHGIRQGKVIRGQESISDQAVTLAEALREEGFTTFAVTSNPHLAAQFGFQQGFQRYSNLSRGSAAEVFRRVNRWRSDIKWAPKVFLWLHFFDPHLPYEPHPERLSRLRPELSGRRLEQTQGLLKQLRQSLGVAPARAEPAARFASFRAEVEALYESDIGAVNEQLSEVLRVIPRFRDGLICFTADHGEEFLEHGYLGHGFNLHEETVRVPLVLVHPQLSGGQRVSLPFSQVDLAPTLLTLVGGRPPAAWTGRSAFDSRGAFLLQGEGSAAGSPVIAEVSRFELKKPQASLLSGRLKLIVTGDDPRSSKAPLANPTRLELFDLAQDPAERRDISRASPADTERLFRQLMAHLAAAPKVGSEAEKLVLSSETLKALKALGYLQ